MRYSEEEYPSSASLRRCRRLKLALRDPVGSLGRALELYLETRPVTKTIRQLGLQVKGKKAKRYSSFKGDITPAPENLVQRNFHAERPHDYSSCNE